MPIPASDPVEWLLVEDVAAELKCTRRHVLNMIHRGELKAYKFGRLYRVHHRDLKRALKPVLTGVAAGGDAA